MDASDDAMPVLWLCGPPGVGKTSAAWELFTRLGGDGARVGYVDIDQLGMCYAAPTADDGAPEPPADPGRHRLKEANLGAVAANFRAAGARGLIVSGVVDAERGVAAIPGADVTLVRLRANADGLRRRVAERGRSHDAIDAVLAEADALDRGGVDATVIDTTVLGIAEVADAVGARFASWPPPAPAATPPMAPPAT
ncbi:MAG TPA: AAA family ATPase, partial [Stackebrandtia sp.]|uniref:AAA family ATPase n=1 Tax=Stackebrandtia sp. TaxID=2023065 RepID=UPI002D53E993